MVLMAFNESVLYELPFEPTTVWFGRLAENERLIRASVNSVGLALANTVIATALGTRTRHSSRPGQLRDPQAPEGPSVAHQKTTLPSALHPDFRLLAQPGGTLVRSHQPTRHQARLLRQRRPTRQHDRDLHRTIQCLCLPLHLGRHRRVDLQQAPTSICPYWRDRTLGRIAARNGRWASGRPRRRAQSGSSSRPSMTARPVAST